MNYPKYLSHKEVSAAKIAAVDHGADGSITVHLEGGFDSVVISHHDRKHKPAPEKGWYLVQYSDGYISFSPAAAFEEGYALVGEDVALVDGIAEPQASTSGDDGEDEDEEDEKEPTEEHATTV
jgi:hypothetical protein